MSETPCPPLPHLGQEDRVLTPSLTLPQAGSAMGSSLLPLFLLLSSTSAQYNVYYGYTPAELTGWIAATVSKETCTRCAKTGILSNFL